MLRCLLEGNRRDWMSPTLPRGPARRPRPGRRRAIWPARWRRSWRSSSRCATGAGRCRFCSHLLRSGAALRVLGRSGRENSLWVLPAARCGRSPRAARRPPDRRRAAASDRPDGPEHVVLVVVLEHVTPGAGADGGEDSGVVVDVAMTRTPRLGRAASNRRVASTPPRPGIWVSMSTPPGPPRARASRGGQYRTSGGADSRRKDCEDRASQHASGRFGARRPGPSTGRSVCTAMAARPRATIESEIPSEHTPQAERQAVNGRGAVPRQERESRRRRSATLRAEDEVRLADVKRRPKSASPTGATAARRSRASTPRTAPE